MTRCAPDRPDRSDQSGFSLVEVVVSMFLLAVVAMAFAPLVAGASTAAATSSTLATATHLVSGELERVRAKPLTTCPVTGPEPLGNQVGSPVKDGRGVELTTWGKFETTCSGGTGLVRYVVSVTRASTTRPVATATTLLPVGAR